MVTTDTQSWLDVLPLRIQRMREAFMQVTPSISIERAVALTQVAKDNPGLPPVLLKAKGFYHACQTIPIYIGQDELIVGHPGGRSRAAVFSPEVCWRWLEKELDTVHSRPQDPYFISEGDKEILRKDVFPFWQGKSVEEYITSEMSELGILPLTLESGIIDCEVKSTSGGGDLSPGYANILFQKGFLGIKADAQNNLRQLDPTSPDSLAKIYFLRAVLTVCDGMALLAARYSGLAATLAAAEANPRRKAELETIAAICRQVPAHPPRTFQEALQAIWFGQVSLFLEENTSGTSPGRIDQYLYPFFCEDLAQGSLTKMEAQELFYCFLLKFNEIPWLLSQFATRYFAGYMPFMNIVIGGQMANGKDATNELTYLILDCVKNLRVYQPSLAARIHSRSPQTFLLSIGDLVREGLGFPALHFDDTTIKMLLCSGIPLEDARDYCIMGCVEPYIHGKLSRWTSACYTNFPAAIEFALFDGWHAQSNRQLGLSTGNPANFHTFEEFESAVNRQLVHLIDIAATATNVAQSAHKRYLPKPVSSCLVEGCIESGKDIMGGGAKYNAGPGVIFVGLADYANSMAAVKKLVYEDKLFSMEHLCNALKNNFVGYDDVKHSCLRAPKYGNDDDYVDYFAVGALDFVATELHKHKTLYARLELGTLSVTTNVPQGLVIGALPSGRTAQAPLADGISPAQGTDRRGPTAAIKSVDKLNQANSSIGTLFNMTFSPTLLADERGLANFAALLRTHHNLGGAQIQFNCTSRQTLLEAQEFPERHRNLVIRVSGYSAFFTELCKEVQDDIISRTQQTSW